MLDEQQQPLLPPTTRHSVVLKDGRNLAYYTFDTVDDSVADATDEDDKNINDKPQQPKHRDKKHPVLYVHGWPSTGVESQLCARHVMAAGCELFAIDRPGMGFSDPYPPPPAATPSSVASVTDGDDDNDDDDDDASNNTDDDGALQNLQISVNDTWEFVENQLGSYDEFSIIGVSGGGAFTLALLASWLERAKQTKQRNKIPKLRSVAVVAGVCASAGTDNMADENKQLVDAVASCPTSTTSRGFFRFMLSIPSAMVSYLPTRWVAALIPTKNLPQVDKDILAANDGQMKTKVVELFQLGFRQGSLGAYNDACISLRANHAFETVLKDVYSSSDNNHLPVVGIFQGDLDVNVPASHAVYMHEEIFSDKATLKRYKDMGHFSIVNRKAEEIAQFVVSSRSQ